MLYVKSLLFLILIASHVVWADIPIAPEGSLQEAEKIPDPGLSAKEAIDAVRQRMKAPKKGENFGNYEIVSAIFTNMHEAGRWTIAGAFPITPIEGKEVPKVGKNWFWFVALRNKEDAKDGLFFMVGVNGRIFRGPEKLYNYEAQ